MLERFFPDHEAESAYDIDYRELYRAGYRGIIFDIDNTLVPHGAPADERAAALFAQLHEIGYATVLLSNNKEPRVKSWSRWVRTGAIRCLWEISFLRMYGEQGEWGSSAI